MTEKNEQVTPSAEDSVVIQMEHAIIGHVGSWQLGPIDLEVRRGTFWGIVGPNGAGKTTLLRSMVHLLPLIAGHVTLSGSARRRGGITYVPQRDALDPVFPVTALSVVMMGLAPGLGFGRPYFLGHRRRAMEALERVELQHMARVPFRQLSGGEQQRVLLARATVDQPAVMLLDEPTAAMDVDAERAVLDLIKGLAHEQNMAVLMVSHGIRVVRKHADRVIFINREKQEVLVGTPTEILGVREPAKSETLQAIHGTVDSSCKV